MFPATLGSLLVLDVCGFPKISRPNTSSGALSEDTTTAIKTTLQSTVEEYYAERQATKPHEAAHTEAHCVPSRMYGGARKFWIASGRNRQTTALVATCRNMKHNAMRNMASSGAL